MRLKAMVSFHMPTPLYGRGKPAAQLTNEGVGLALSWLHELARTTTLLL